MVEETASPSRWGFRSFFFGNAPVLPPQAAAAKVGAGLLLRDARGDCLLLLRRSLNNDMTWGLPGGNAETVDGAAHAARLRRKGPDRGLTRAETPRPQWTCMPQRCARRRRSWGDCRRCACLAAT